MFVSFSLKLISLYQKVFSLDTGFLRVFKKNTNPVCVFYPRCSEYTKQALTTYGFWKGWWFGLRRISRCVPWQKNHIDPLP